MALMSGYLSTPARVKSSSALQSIVSSVT